MRLKTQLIAAAALTATSAFASFPRLTASSDYAAVDIRVSTSDAASADAMPAQGGIRPVKANENVDGPEGGKVCVRRSNVANDASSGFGAWTCASGSNGGMQNQPNVTRF